MLSITCLPTAHEEIALRIQPLSFVKMITLTRLSQKYLLPVTRGYLRIASPVTVLSAKLHSSTSFQLELRNIDSNSVVKSPLPDVRVPEINLYNHVFRDAALFGKKIAIVNGETGREYSFAEVEEATCRVSSALNRSGLQKGDVLTLVAPNSPEYAILFLATLASGGIVSTSNPNFTDEELAYQFKNSVSKMIATVPSALPTVQKAAERVGIEKIIVLDTTGIGDSKHISYRSLVEDTGSRFSPASVNAKDDIAVLPYSSGTTGFPKGVMLTHFSVVANMCQLEHPQLFDFRQDGVCLMGLLPFFHIYGMAVILFTSMHSGSKVISLPKFDGDTFLTAIQKYRINILHLAPPLALFLAKHPSVDKYDTSSIDQVVSGGAPLSGELVTAVRERLGCRLVRQLYGLTETSPVTHVVPEMLGMTKPNSIGIPVRNMEVKIVDTKSLENLPVGQEGEVWMRGPNIMKGYLNLPDATKFSITEDGWFRTGDIGYFDEEGCFYITDRLKELIKVKGFQVAPAELEALLQNHPKIADAAVVGIPNERLGEAPRAFVVKKDPNVTEEEIVNYVASKVTKHKHLVGGVEFIEAVPKSPSGKILRRMLRKK